MIVDRPAFLNASVSVSIVLAALVAAWSPGGAAPGRPESRAGTDTAGGSPDTLHPEARRVADSAAVARKDSSLAAADSGGADSATLQARFYEYVAHPVLQVLTLPVEMVLVPGVKAIIYPIKSPIRYVLRNNVIDRTIQLISFGESEQIMLYPTLNLAPGTSSYTGLTLRHGAVFGRPTERMVAMGLIYVNGDWKFRGYMTFSEVLGTRLEAKAALQFNRVKNTSTNQPGTSSSWYFADTSNVIYGQVSYPLFEHFSAKSTFVFRDNHYGLAPPQKDSLVSPFFPRNDSGFRDPRLRGLEKSWYDRILSVGLSRDTRNNENITLAGSNLSVSANYHLTTAAHDYYGWEGTWTGYYKLGKERYEITSEEERKAGGMNIRKVLKEMEMRKLKGQLLNRKVVALHVYSAQSFEIDGNRMPVYGLNTLGNDTPMRGYGGSRFRDYTVLSVGGEYRFPVIRLMDGVIFNEYGVRGRSWDKIEYLSGLKNSWGFGVNVRRPDIFLFRAQAGFHGLHGVQVNLSVDTNY
jgi:hypothetical protein